MRFFAFTIFCLCAVSFAQNSLKILTFNTMLVCVGPGCILAEEVDLDSRATRIGEFIQKQQVDIVLLQEVLKAAHFERIRKASGMAHGFMEGNGLAVLSRYSLKNPRWFAYRWQGACLADCKRLSARIKIGALFSEVELPGGQTIRIGNTHLLPRYTNVEGFELASDAHTPQRKINLLELASYLNEQTDASLPLVLGGDFNMNQRSDEYRFFEKVFGLTDSLRTVLSTQWEKRCTYCGSNPHVQRQNNKEEGILDHIFLSKGDFKPAAAQVISTVEELSDHRPVVAEVELTPSSKKSTFALSDDEIPSLKDQVAQVSIHYYCRFAPLAGWFQRSETKSFLDSLSFTKPPSQD